MEKKDKFTDIPTQWIDNNNYFTEGNNMETKEKAHTPTPWFIDIWDGTEYGVFSREHGLLIELHSGNFKCSKANAAFIVKAVNSHEALLEAVKAAYNMLPVTVTPQEFLRGDGNWGLTKGENIEATVYAKAIALAEGK